MLSNYILGWWQFAIPTFNWMAAPPTYRTFGLDFYSPTRWRWRIRLLHDWYSATWGIEGGWRRRRSWCCRLRRGRLRLGHRSWGWGFREEGLSRNKRETLSIQEKNNIQKNLSFNLIVPLFFRENFYYTGLFTEQVIQE